MTFNVHATSLSSVRLIENRVFQSTTGRESILFDASQYGAFGMKTRFVHERILDIDQNTLHGLYYHKSGDAAQLVTVLSGSVSIVGVDACPDSNMFGEWLRIDVTPQKNCQIYLGPGIAFGFATTEDETAKILLKQTVFDDPRQFGGILWNDPELSIEWPGYAPKVDMRDNTFPCLKEIHTAALPQKQTQITV